MPIQDLFKTGYTAIKITEDNSGVVKTQTPSTDTTIGTAGVFEAHQRQLSGYEVFKYGHDGHEEMARFYTQVSGLTQKHLIKDLDGKYWSIVNIDDPHDLAEFLQIDTERKQWEQENE